MKKRLLLTIAVMLSGMTAFSQLTNGFYRVQNLGTQRYLYVRDCTGEVSTLGADMGALELWPRLEDALSDPGSVIYLRNVGGAYDLTSQGTGVNEMTGRYMSISYDGKYAQVYNSGMYLYDMGNSDFNPEQGLIGALTNKEMPGKTNQRLWIPTKVESQTDNFFGFKPTVEHKGKYYRPFYADFAYTPVKDACRTWYVSQIDKEYGIAVIKEIKGTVARSQAVFVECISNSPSDNRADLLSEGGSKANGNLLTGTYFDNADRSAFSHKDTDPAIIPFDAKTMRVLATDAEGNLAYVNDDATVPTYEQVFINKKWRDNVKCIAHNQSFLMVTEDCPATLKVMTVEEYDKFLLAAGMHGVDFQQDDLWYDLQGNAVKGQPRKGIYIRNGKKHVVR